LEFTSCKFNMKQNDNKVLCLADDVVTALYFLVFLFAH